MIIPAGSIYPDSSYLIPTLYGRSPGNRLVQPSRQEGSPGQRDAVQDLVSLSPAAKRILDQTARLAAANPTVKE